MAGGRAEARATGSNADGVARLGGVANGLLHRYLRWCYELAELSMVLCSEPIAWAAVVVPNRADC